jgi:hypothetical protein
MIAHLIQTFPMEEVGIQGLLQHTYETRARKQSCDSISKGWCASLPNDLSIQMAINAATVKSANVQFIQIGTLAVVRESLVKWCCS